MATLTINPAYRALLAANGLADFDALFVAGDASHIDGHATRSVSRLELRGADGKPVVLYLKRQWGPSARPPLADLMQCRWPMLPAHREWINLTRLVRAGIPTATPVVWGHGRGPSGPRSLLATLAVNGRSLARWIEEAAPTARTGDAAWQRHSVADAIGLAVRQLHDAGFSFPDLYAKHVYIDESADEPRIALIDVYRLRRFLPWRAAEDFAALYVTTQAAGVTQSDRWRVLLAYLDEAYPGSEAVEFAERIARAAAGMEGRGRDPNLLVNRRTAAPGMVPLADERMTDIDGGRLRINEAFRPVLAAAGLLTLDAIMAVSGGESYREVPGRSTVRLELPDPAGGTRVFYVKRYTAVPRREKLRRLIARGPAVSLARQEVLGIVRVSDQGIPTMRRVAFGGEVSPGGWRERSCLITEEIAGATQADDYAEARFAGPPSREKTAAKRRLIRGIAQLARRLHTARLAHRDFYLCHILVRPVVGGEPVLHLIDLQRIESHARGRGERWRVKDLAALLFSSWPSPATGIRSAVFTHTDALRFAHEYFMTNRLTDDQKDLARRVIAKARWIAAHESRRRARKAAHG